MGKIKVVMLAGKGESTTLMFNGIKDNFLIEKVIVEAPVSKYQLLKRRAKTLGLMKVIGQMAFMGFNLVLKRVSIKRIDEIKRDKNLDDKPIDNEFVTEVDSVNSLETIAILKKLRPDVIVVNGTRIIQKEVLAQVAVPFINSHVGITPKYRGVHGGYWALAEKDRKNCGVTIHLIDAGIDTGGILQQAVINATDKDNFNTYPYLQMAAAIPLMNKAIHEVSSNTHKIQSVSLPSKLWTHPTIMEYLQHWVMGGVK